MRKRNNNPPDFIGIVIFTVGVLVFLTGGFYV